MVVLATLAVALAVATVIATTRVLQPAEVQAPIETQPEQTTVATRAEPVPSVQPHEPPSPPAVPRVPERKVTLETTPACDVYVGKRKLGHSPVDVAVGPEPMNLRLVSSLDSINFDYPLAPKRGETVRRIEIPRATLDLRVSPWAEVTLDGKAIGMSPIPPTSVYAGHHALDLVNAELKVKRHVDVELGPGETRTVRERLE